MEVPHQLPKLLNADSEGIVVFTGQDLMKIPNSASYLRHGQSMQGHHPLPMIITELGEKSSKVR